MNSDLISVIVPTFNNAPWLPRCLDSILAQTHQNLEVIVVDDGSADDTPAILAEYTARDSRVKAIRKENGGVTSARLRGVSEAAGEWVGFVDGDDRIEPQMYARLLENAHTYETDISHCGHQMIYPDGTVDYYYNTGILRHQDNLTGLRDLLEEKIVEPGLCNKLYRRVLFDALEERMDLTVKNNEDLLMNYYLFEKARKSVFEDVCPYHYLIRQNSASRKKLNHNRIYDPIRVKEIILSACRPELQEDARRAMAETCLFTYAQLTREAGREYDADRKNVRRIIAEQMQYIHLLPRRNALLVRIVSTAPWIFHFVYTVYYVLLKKKPG